MASLARFMATMTSHSRPQPRQIFFQYLTIMFQFQMLLHAFIHCSVLRRRIQVLLILRQPQARQQQISHRPHNHKLKVRHIQRLPLGLRIAVRTRLQGKKDLSFDVPIAQKSGNLRHCSSKLSILLVHLCGGAKVIGSSC